MRSKLTEAEEALEMSVNKKADKDKAVVQVETRIEQAEKVLSGLTVETKKFSGGINAHYSILSFEFLCFSDDEKLQFTLTLLTLFSWRSSA